MDVIIKPSDMQDTMLFKWLQETINRLFLKEPKYFRYWTWLSYVAMAISGIPYVLVQFNITLPEPWATLSNKAVTGAGIAVFWMSKLVVKPPVQKEVVKESVRLSEREKQLPFTAKEEAKEVVSINNSSL